MAKIGRPIGPGKPVTYRVYKHGRYAGTYEKEELKERFGIPLKGLKGKIKVGTIFTGGYTVAVETDERPSVEEQPAVKARMDGVRCSSGVRFSSGGGKMWRT